MIEEKERTRDKVVYEFEAKGRKGMLVLTWRFLETERITPTEVVKVIAEATISKRKDWVLSSPIPLLERPTNDWWRHGEGIRETTYVTAKTVEEGENQIISVFQKQLKEYEKVFREIDENREKAGTFLSPNKILEKIEEWVKNNHSSALKGIREILGIR